MCVGGACGLGKVRRLHLAGVGAESEQGGGGHGFAVESEGLRRGTVRTPGGGERDRSARRRPRQGAGGGSPVWSPASSRPLTIPSKAPEISVLSACGNVVWRKVAPRPRAPAPPPHGAPPHHHIAGSRVLPLPALRPRPPPPPSQDTPPGRLPGRANLEQPPGPLERNLGQLGLEAASHSWFWSPGAARASGSSGAGEMSWPGLECLPGGMERTCRSAWSKDCSVAEGGGRLRQLPAAEPDGDPGTDPWIRTHGTYLTFRSGFLRDGR